jgi:multiple sugar transport system permease protein
MAGPYAAFLLIFSVYPIVFALVLVFLQWDLVTTPTFAGADNLRLLIHDGRFWRAVANTFVFLSIHVPVQIFSALALALALNRQLAGRSFWRAAFFLPVVISGAVVAILWSNLYATDVGLINKLLMKIGVSPVPWLTDPRTAMPSIAVMVTWKNVGFYVIIYLAGLQYIPRSCQEAIEIEGATAWQRFRYLTLPSLLPQTILVVTLSTINGFQLFIEPYVMTGGGPLRRTFSVVLYLYNNAFSYQKMGYAATIGVALALIIGAVVFAQRRVIGSAEAS